MSSHHSSWSPSPVFFTFTLLKDLPLDCQKQGHSINCVWKDLRECTSLKCQKSMCSYIMSFSFFPGSVPVNKFWWSIVFTSNKGMGMTNNFFFIFVYLSLMVVEIETFTSPQKCFMTFIYKCHCSIKASRLRRLPALSGVLELSVSFSFRPSRGT